MKTGGVYKQTNPKRKQNWKLAQMFNSGIYRKLGDMRCTFKFWDSSSRESKTFNKKQSKGRANWSKVENVHTAKKHRRSKSRGLVLNILVIGHGLQCVPIYWPGHSAPRDQCRGNTQSNNMLKISSVAQNCEKNTHFLEIWCVLSAVYFDVVAISCIEESGSKCGDRFVCCQSF